MTTVRKQPRQLVLGGLTVPGDHDGQGWHDLAMERARVEGIPVPPGLRANSSGRGADSPLPTLAEIAEVQAILDRHGITMDAIEAQIDVEQAGIADGTVVPLSSVRHTNSSNTR